MKTHMTDDLKVRRLLNRKSCIDKIQMRRNGGGGDWDREQIGGCASY